MYLFYLRNLQWIAGGSVCQYALLGVFGGVFHLVPSAEGTLLQGY